MNNAVMDERLERINRLFEKAQQLMENVEKFKQSYESYGIVTEQPKIEPAIESTIEPVVTENSYEAPATFTQSINDTPDLGNIQSISQDVKQSIQETSEAYEEIDLDALLSSMDLNLDL